MDINQMVQDLMRAERMPMDRLKQDKQVIEWRMAEYRSVNLKLDQFRTNIFDTVLRRSNMMSNKASSSNSSLVTATATSSASAGTLRISEVSQLANAASNASSTAITDGTKIDATKSFKDQAFGDNTVWTQGIVNREVVTVSEKTSTISLTQELGNADSVVVKVNGASFKVVETFSEDATIRATEVMRDDANKALVFGKELAKDQKVEVTAFSASATGEDFYSETSITAFNAKGEKVTDKFVFTSDQTMNDVIKQMNASPTGVNVFYDEHSDKLSVIRKETGQFNTDQVWGTDPKEFNSEMMFTGDLFQNGFQLDSSNDTGNEIGGQNASFTINGLTTERQSNTFTINGVSISLQGTFTENQAVTLNTSTNVDSIMDTIKGFVKEYNELLELVNGKIKEDVHRDFRPLSEEQRKEMSDTEIERWEEKAMSGMLRNDQTLRNGFTKFRTDMYAPVSMGFDGAFNQLTEIGIKTTSNYREGGKLEINEDKLRAAIEQDPESVYQLFAADGTTSAEKGLARRIRDSANGLIEQISQRAGGLKGRSSNHQFTLGREMTRIEDRLTNFERRLQQVENRYWAQFTAMEKAVAQSNSQGEALFAQMFGGQQ
ncbi:flagellar capping protein [Salipaludibacillus neizhouensis]|uniref:Flagellar hook-associated protein 2 n=2 Tax=Salipaludibacillus neizhouensis TaxID=885475 RepID=A0A3A9KKY4_9BACI|nr:flagellar capping protein [Salipaludibacillus neizhouensis]